MQCHSTNWAGALDRTLRTDVSPWAMTLGALPALGRWATRTVWEGIRAGTLGRAGTCQLFLSLWLLGPVVTSEHLQPGLEAQIRAKEERYGSTCGLETQTYYPFPAPFCCVT